MSFAGTPLGQNRRLDHNTFLGKPNLNPNNPTPPHRAPAISYAAGAPTHATRSPPRPSRERSRLSLNDDEDDNQPALSRVASTAGSQSNNTSGSNNNRKLDPSKWAVKDTSVNVASAFHQAILGDMPPAPYNPNAAWASGSTQPNIVPRSTSVEYEQSVRAATKRGAPAPPSRRGRDNASNTSIGSGTGARRPLQQQNSSASTLIVPDSQPEEEGSSLDIGRAKSPVAAAVDVATNLAKGAMNSFSRLEFKLREPSFRHDGDESFAANGSRRETSYDYAAEEQYVRNIQEQDKKEKKSHRKGRISEDNRAYKPSVDSEDDDDYVSDDGKPRKKKKDQKGPNMRLPVISADKRRKKTKKKTTAGGSHDGEEEDEQDDRQEEDQSLTQVERPPSRGRSLPPADQSTSFEHNTTLDSDTQLLDSIPEIDESQVEPMDIDSVSALSAQKQAEQKTKRHRTRSRSRTRSTQNRFSIGGLLGTLVHFCVQAISATMYFFGRILGSMLSIVTTPSKWVGGSGEGFKKLGRYFTVAGLVLAATMALNFVPGARVPNLSNPFSVLPVPSISWGSKPRYTAPETPIENIADLVDRLARIEQALTGLVDDNERVASKAEDGVNRYREVLGMIGSLEGKIRSATEVTGEVRGVKKEVEVLQAELRVRERDAREKEREREERERRKEKEREEREKEWILERERIEKEVARGGGGKVNVDEEKIRWLEDKVGSVESGIREAIEIGKKAAASASSAVAVASSASSVASSAAAVATSSTSSSNGSGAAWWSKIGSGVSSKSSITIKSADGQDVTGLISHLVDSAMALFKHDGLAKPDYALHSGGARVIPHLTSPTLEIRPPLGLGTVVGLITGNGYAIGRPPVTALHHEMHSGHCWPFQGDHGQLGVALAMPVIIEEITIDHLAKEVAFDMRSAPKEMEVWGLVEGKDNLEKVARWTAEKKERKKAAETVPTEDGPVEIGTGTGTETSEEEEFVYPSTLPKHAPYIRIANFTYDVSATESTQTFPVDPEIKALNMDFGVVALRVLSNWGKEFTCLYRFRVHGSRVGETPSPIPGIDDSIPSEEESS